MRITLILFILSFILLASCSNSDDNEGCNCIETRTVYNADDTIRSQVEFDTSTDCSKDGQETFASGNNGSYIIDSWECN